MRIYLITHSYLYVYIHIYIPVFTCICIYMLHVFHCLLFYQGDDPISWLNQASQLLGPSLKWQTAVTFVEGSCCDGTVTWAAVGGVTWWDDVVSQLISMVGGHLCRTSMDITCMAFIWRRMWCCGTSCARCWSAAVTGEGPGCHVVTSCCPQLSKRKIWNRPISTNTKELCAFQVM